MTLKEYVVYEGYKGIFGIKTKAAWESYLEQCDTRKIPDSERFRIISTFNADEQLQEQKGLRLYDDAEWLEETEPGQPVPAGMGSESLIRNSRNFKRVAKRSSYASFYT